jgi:hypothetical protein
MTTPSNLYAEKIFSEHPLEMWSLDDKTSYLSWIEPSERDLPLWTINESLDINSTILTRGEDVAFDDAQYEQNTVPFLETFQQQIHLDSVPAGGGTITLTSNALKFDSSQINPLSGCISVGLNIFSNDESVYLIKIGYLIESPTQVTILEPVSFGYSNWYNLMKVFNQQPTNSPYPVKMLIEITLTDSSSSPVDLFVNGIVFGQGAEYFGSESLGIEYGTIPDGIWLPSAMEQREGIVAKPYGLSDKDGYYIIHKDFETVSESGIPMVYGSNTSTILNPLLSTDNIPNLIIPAKGFLNEIGKHKTLTLEFWTKINHNGNVDTNPYRLVGPTNGTDGLYVDDSFLIIKIGEAYSSFFVGEWARPMLIQFEVSPNVANLTLNGAQVISMIYDTSTTDFLPHINSVSQESQDWLGFYSPLEIVDSIELDCVAIYSYSVPEVLAKRRFVYGQGVEYPLNLNTAYGGTSVYVDFSKSGYLKNISYPTTSKWVNGIVDNLIASRDGVSYPDYVLPQYIHPSKNRNTWILENKETALGSMLEEATFMIDPSSDGENVFLNIPDLSNFNGKKAEVIGCVVIPGSDAIADNSQSIFTIYNESTKDYLRASIKLIGGSQKLVYSIQTNGVEYDIYSTSAEVSQIAAGINITNIVSYIETLSQDIYANDIFISAASLLNTSQLTLYIGPDPDNSTVFDGKYLKMFVMNTTNLNNQFAKNPLFEDSFTNGMIDAISSDPDLQAVKDVRATYEVKPMLHGPTGYILDVACSGSWYDYVPLSMLSRKVYSDAAEVDTVEDLDFIQFNISYPENIDSSIFKSYVSFEYATLFSQNFGTQGAYDVVQSASNVFEPGIASPWSGKKYEISDGGIVYTPVDEGVDKPVGAPEVFDFKDVMMTIHMDFNIDSINYQPIRISTMDFSGVSLNYESRNPVNTRFAIPISPESIIDDAIDYKARNPYRISKSSLEYLNLTSKSGIELAYDNNTSRRLSIEMNPNLDSSYRISSLQFAFNHREYFSETKELAFTLTSAVSGNDVDFYITSINNDNTRGILTAEMNGNAFNIGDFYINGIKSTAPVVKRGEWTMLGISFTPALDYSYIDGQFIIYSKILINNFSYYQIPQETINQYQIFKKWSEIDNQTWDYWKLNAGEAPNTWESMVSSNTSLAMSIPATDIYKIFMGTNKVVSDSRSDDLSFAFPYYQYIVYNNVSRQSRIQKPL